MTLALIAGGAALGPAAPASAATVDDVIATVDTGSALSDGLAVDTGQNSVYVVHPDANMVSVIDTTTNTVKATIAVGEHPFRVAVDPGLHRAYVTNVHSNSVSVIDTTTNMVVSTITHGRLVEPRGVAVDPVTHLVHVTVYQDNQMLAVIDPTASPATIEFTNLLESRPWAVDVDPTTHRAYPTTLFGGTVSTVSGTTILSTIHGFGGPTQITVDPVSKRAYVAHSGTMSVLDISTDTPVVTGTLAAGNGPSDLAIDQGTRMFYVTNYHDATVSVMDANTSAVMATLPVGFRPMGVEVDPATHRAYVVNSNNTVSVIAAFESQEIAFTFTSPSPSPSPSSVVVGDSRTVTASGGNSNQPVVFSTSSDACTVTSAGEVDFTHAGDCVVDADQTGDATYAPAPTVTQTFTVGQAPQVITFTSQPPTPATVGADYAVTATGGGSGQPVTFSVDPATTNAACTVVNGTVSFHHVGSCVIAADQAGNDDYAAAPTATQQLGVGLEQTTTEVTLSTGGVVFGQPATATAAVTDDVDGSVQFTVDGNPVGSPVTLDQDGAAASPDLVGPGFDVGSHEVGADFTPTNTNRYADSSATPQTLTVSQSATTSSVSVGANAVTSTVTPTEPGTGVPTGTVRFYLAGSEIGSAGLTNGTATLAYQVPPGSTREISTVYAGDASFTGSSASTARRDPVITATLTSAKTPRNGWYRTPVTVTFTCEATSAPLTKACPAPVTRSRNAGGQSVTRAITATDGGAATVVVGLDIDAVPPAVQVTGVRRGATYFATGPRAGCRASDSISGVASCTVKRTTRRNRVIYLATATDRAGNRSRTRLAARTSAVVVSGAAMRDGRYVVQRGRTYTVLVAAATRPSYLYASPTPRRPAGGRIPFERIRHNRWALGVTFKEVTSHHTWWNLGTKVGSRTTVTTVRVVR